MNIYKIEVRVKYHQALVERSPGVFTPLIAQRLSLNETVVSESFEAVLASVSQLVDKALGESEGRFKGQENRQKFILDGFQIDSIALVETGVVVLNSVMVAR